MRNWENMGQSEETENGAADCGLSPGHKAGLHGPRVEGKLAWGISMVRGQVTLYFYPK